MASPGLWLYKLVCGKDNAAAAGNVMQGIVTGK